MIILNVTIVTEPEKADDAVKALSRFAREIPASSPALHPRILRLSEIPQDPDYAQQAPSLSLQLEFPAHEDARVFLTGTVEPFLQQLPEELGGEVLSISSLLEEIES